MSGEHVRVERRGALTTIILDRPQARNAVDRATADALVKAFLAFEHDNDQEAAVFGVFCRRWGVPLVDGGTVRLPRLIGQSRALDMILTGRPVGAEEAYAWGLANRVVPRGESRRAAEELALEIARFPEICMK